MCASLSLGSEGWTHSTEAASLLYFKDHLHARAAMLDSAKVILLDFAWLRVLGVLRDCGSTCLAMGHH